MNYVRTFDVLALCLFSILPSPGGLPRSIFLANFVDGGNTIATQLHHAISDGRTMSQLATFVKRLLTQQKSALVPERQLRLGTFENDIKVGDPYDIVKECDERRLMHRDKASPGVVSKLEDASDTV